MIRSPKVRVQGSNHSSTRSRDSQTLPVSLSCHPKMLAYSLTVIRRLLQIQTESMFKMGGRGKRWPRVQLALLSRKQKFSQKLLGHFCLYLIDQTRVTRLLLVARAAWKARI